jgi:hypothetical protein
VEYEPHGDVEHVPDIMRGTLPDIEFAGRKIIPHQELADALLTGSLIFDESDYVFIDHSQSFDPKLVASLDPVPAQREMTRYASIRAKREICAEAGIGRGTRSKVAALEAGIHERMIRIRKDLTKTVNKLRRHPFRMEEQEENIATAQTMQLWEERLETFGFAKLADLWHLSGNLKSPLNPTVLKTMTDLINDNTGPERIGITALHDKLRRKLKQMEKDRRADVKRRQALGEDIPKEDLAELKVPSIKTVANYMKKRAPLRVGVGTHGKAWLLSNCLAVGMGLEVDRLGQIVMIDEYAIGLMTIVPFEVLKLYLSEDELKERKITANKPLRATMSVMIEALSGCIVGLQIALSADQDLAKRTFQMCLSDKTKLSQACGAICDWNQFLRPERILHDSGSAYIAGATDLHCAQLRIDKIAAPKSQAYLRGLMERVFRTVHSSLLSGIPGKTFSNPVERGTYNSEAEAVLTLDEFVQILVIWVVDIYHNSESFGRDGLTPAEIWRHEMTFGIGCRPVPSLPEMTHIFGISLFRKPGPRGITVAGLSYSSRAFMQLMLQTPLPKLQVRWFEEDLSYIQVKIGKDSWMSLEVMDPRAKGISFQEWLVEKRREEVKRNPANKDICDAARDQIDALIEQSTKGRGRMARKSITPEELTYLEEKVLRHFKTPNEAIKPEQTHGLYGAPIGQTQVGPFVGADKPAESEEPTARSRPRRPNQKWDTGEME